MSTSQGTYIAPDVPLVRTSVHDRLALRTAAQRARRAYPGPVGELIARELLAWDEFGWVLGTDALTTRLVQHVMALPPPSHPTSPIAVVVSS